VVRESSLNNTNQHRYDDTNPEAEEGRYFSSILESVRWLGFEPWKITYSSDNFQKLYEYAVQMIERGRAYVCHCDRECLMRRSSYDLTVDQPRRSVKIEEEDAETQRPVSTGSDR
jgi:glutamyl/glutaminyl-tRNA synthetase